MKFEQKTIDFFIKINVAKKSSKNSPWKAPEPHFGGVWEGLGRLWDALGRILDAFWAPHGRSWVSPGHLSGLLGASWALKARFGVNLRRVWGGFGEDLGGSWEDLARILANVCIDFGEMWGCHQQREATLASNN